MSLKPITELHSIYLEEVLKPQLGQQETQKSSESPKDTGGDSSKKISQAVYDIRYRARREDMSVDQAFNQYMSHTSMNATEKDAVRDKLGIGPGAKKVEEENIPEGKKYLRVDPSARGTEEKIYYRTYDPSKPKDISKRHKLDARGIKTTATDYVPKTGKAYDSQAGEKYEKKYGSSKGKNSVGDLDKDGSKEPDGHEYAGVKDKAIKKAISDRKKNVKEGFSNWRDDLVEVVNSEKVEANSQKKSQVKEKNVKNKVVINPSIEEATQNLGAEYVEISEMEDTFIFEGVLDEFCDAELVFLSNEIIEETVIEFYEECLEEGYELKNITNILIESLDTSLEMICEVSDSYYDSAVETSKKNASKSKRENKTQKVKDAVKKVGKKLAHGLGYAAGKTVQVAKKVGSEIKKGYEASDDSDDSSSARRPQSYRYSRGSEHKSGLLSRLGSTLKKGLKKAVKHGAAAVSRGARNISRSVKEENINEVSPPGFGGTVKAMKKHKEIDNPFALAWYMKKKGYKSHKKEDKRVKEDIDPKIVDQKQTKKDDNVRDMQSDASKKQQIQNLKMVQQKQQMMQRQKLNLQKSGKLPLDNSYDPEGELVDEALRSREERMARMITPAQRKKQEDDRKKKQEIEHKANLALAGMKKTAKPGAATKTTSKSSAPESNRQLKSGKKVDTLAVKATKVIKSSYEPEGESIDELRRSELEGKGSPETRHPEGPGGLLSGVRGQNKERGAAGGRRWDSGGEGGSKSERGKKKNQTGSQSQRLNQPERVGRYLERLRNKRGDNIPSN